MRVNEEVKIKPSVRQTQAIPQLLSAKYFRNGRLTLDDFIDAAVHTTYPSDQEIARKIAEDIILGTEKTSITLEAQQPDVKQKSPEQMDALQRVMEQIRKEQELAKTIVKDKVEAGYEYLQSWKDRSDKTLYETARDYLNDGDIVLRGLSNDEELRQEASSELLDRIGNLTSNDIKNAATLDILDSICEQGNAAEQLAAKALRESIQKDTQSKDNESHSAEDIVKEFEELAQRDPSTAARSLKQMEELKVPDEETLEKLDEILQETLSNLSEATDYARELGRTPDNIDRHIEQAPQEYSLSDAREFTDSIEKSTGKKHSHDLLDEYDQQYDDGASENVDMRQLADYPNGGNSWESLLQKETEDIIDRSQARSSPSDYLKQKLREQMALKQNLPNNQTRQSWQNSADSIANAAIKSTPTKLDLRKTVRFCNASGASSDIETIRETGQNLGMSEDEILELLNPSFKVIKKLLQAGVNDFDRLHNLIAGAGLSQNQLRELADLANQTDNSQALGAIAHEDFAAALGMSTSYRGSQQGGIDQARADKVMGGLLGGPANNIIKIWYSYRDEIPPDLKEKLRRIAKRLLIDLGMRYAKHIMGTSMLGGIMQSTTVRPFRIGDEIDLIDLEETIDSLLSQGRSNFETLEPEDFLIRETYQGHRAFFWALDKSGSMDTPEKLGMLSISVMAGLYGVQKDDFGVLLFDHETHVVKEIANRNVSVEKVAADLLDVRASGGTGASKSMTMALENFKETRAKEKIFILNTDMYLSDQIQCEQLAQEIKQNDIRMIILVPKTSYNFRAAETMAKKAHGVVLDINSIEELPEKLLRITNY